MASLTLVDAASRKVPRVAKHWTPKTESKPAAKAPSSEGAVPKREAMPRVPHPGRANLYPNSKG